VGKEAEFEGVVDLIEEKMLLFTEQSLGQEILENEIPATYIEEFTAARMALIEKLADFDESVMEKFVEDTPVSKSEMYAALRKATLALQVVPVLCGSAFKTKAIQPLLDGIIHYLPSPLDAPPVVGLDQNGNPVSRETDAAGKFCGLVFKLMSDAFVENLAFIRLYSGRIAVGDKVFNSRKGETGKNCQDLETSCQQARGSSTVGGW